MTPRLVAQAWWQLLYLDLIWLRGFRAIRDVVGPRTGPASPTPETTCAAVVAAVNLARTFYLKPVLCLQTSVVVTRLLRRHGVDADLVIGAHLMPIRAHAWVEVAGLVVTETTEAQDSFCILDRW